MADGTDFTVPSLEELALDFETAQSSQAAVITTIRALRALAHLPPHDLACEDYRAAAIAFSNLAIAEALICPAPTKTSLGPPPLPPGMNL